MFVLTIDNEIKVCDVVQKEPIKFYQEKQTDIYGNKKMPFCKNKVIKESENLEDLFDEVVMDNSVNKPLISTLWKDDNLKEQAKKMFIDSLKVGIEVYGAIWTEKCLIYVAKMNEKGEWELC